MRKSQLDQAGPCVNLRVSAGLQVKLTLHSPSNAILSIILKILEAESFELRRLTFLPAWLTNLVAACGLAHSMAAYGGLRWRLWGPCRGRFMVPTQGGSILYVCTKFEAGSSFRSTVIRGSQIMPSRRPLPGGAGRPKFNQLQMVTTFTYRPSLMKIVACNFELSW